MTIFASFENLSHTALKEIHRAVSEV